MPSHGEPGMDASEKRLLPRLGRQAARASRVRVRRETRAAVDELWSMTTRAEASR
jgi:hypothetical protein